MNWSRLLRAFGWSVLVCTATVTVLAGLMQAAQVGGTVQAMLVTTAYFSATFAAVAAVVLAPAFLALGRVTAVLERRSTAAAVGAVLAASASLVVVIIMFRDPADPRSLGGWLRFWAQNAVPFAAGLMPFLVGGATFGYHVGTPAVVAMPPPRPSGRRRR